jgi:hypothetical protein
MDRLHRMELEEDDGEDVIFACVDGCDRRVLVSRSGDLVVLNRGDFYARHRGSTGPAGMSVTVAS